MTTSHPTMTSRKWTRPLAIAATMALLPLAAACTHDTTNLSYTPAAGANASAGPVQLRNIALVSDGAAAALTGAIVTPTEDQLIGIQARNEAQQLGVDLPAQKLVKLDGATLTLRGDIKPGSTTQMVFHFAKSGQASVTVPVIPSTHPDFATVTPTPLPSR